MPLAARWLQASFMAGVERVRTAKAFDDDGSSSTSIRTVTLLLLNTCTVVEPAHQTSFTNAIYHTPPRY